MSLHIVFALQLSEFISDAIKIKFLLSDSYGYFYFLSLILVLQIDILNYLIYMLYIFALK